VSTALRAVKITKSTALAHLAKEVSKEDWSATAAAFRLRVLVGEDVGVLHYIRARLYRAASKRQDQTTRRALETLEVAVGRRAARTCVEPSPATSDDMCVPGGRREAAGSNLR
jgi:hypothetical protein